MLCKQSGWGFSSSIPDPCARWDSDIEMFGGGPTHKKWHGAPFKNTVHTKPLSLILYQSYPIRNSIPGLLLIPYHSSMCISEKLPYNRPIKQSFSINHLDLWLIYAVYHKVHHNTVCLALFDILFNEESLVCHCIYLEQSQFAVCMVTTFFICCNSASPLPWASSCLLFGLLDVATL